MRPYRKLLSVSLLIMAMAALGLLRLEIDTDVARSLPSSDPLIAAGLDFFSHHPIHDQLAVDLMLEQEDIHTLVTIGKLVEERLEASGLFAQVGTQAMAELIPDLALEVSRNLPLLFSAQELAEQVAPLLTAPQLQLRLEHFLEQLNTMEGIGQARFMGQDPLGLKELILARMAPLAPSLKTRFSQGKLLSADGHHLLVTARPLSAGTDTASARRIADLLTGLEEELKARYGPQGHRLRLTPVGAYRAALDNEQLIRGDVQLALVLATAGIGVLLLFSFARPLFGLFSLVPALAGTAAALLVYSLYQPSISIMVLGFGGAIISITVDHGIAYLLFSDRSQEAGAREASHEVRAIGIMAVITSIGAFLLLSRSGFLIFSELGQFTALGIFFSFTFVHQVFPRILPTMPPARRRRLPLRGLVDRCYKTGKPGALAALALVAVLLFFARPDFYVSLSSMNTVSADTLAADQLFTRVWGDLGQRVFVMTRADSPETLQERNDHILARLEQDLTQKRLQSGFVPSMLFPGPARAQQNLAAWHSFWNQQRRQTLKAELSRIAPPLGFSSQAFSDFFSLLEPTFSPLPEPIPERYYDLLGIRKAEQGTGLIQFITLQPGSAYDPEAFLAGYGKQATPFDSRLFTQRLAEILFSTFTTMLVIIAAGVSLLLFFFYLDLPLTLLTLLPPSFAYICTLGTLHLMGRPLDIPALMLSVVILGMGIDYSIFCVRAHQRYRRLDHPQYALVRMAVFLAAGSTLIGFGVLAMARHNLLQSIGITSLLGIGYSLVGTFLLLPPLLGRYLGRQETARSQRKSAQLPLRQRVCGRFRTLEAYPRMFARCKLRFDPMFQDLKQLLAEQPAVRTIIDIGCGYGVPACWLLEQYPQATLHGLDPDPERVRVAALACGSRGIITRGMAPEMPKVPARAELVLLLDMLHYLDEQTATALLQASRRCLDPGGRVVIRSVLAPPGRRSWSWWLEEYRIRLSGHRASYRSQAQLAELLSRTGYRVTMSQLSPANPELFWLVACCDHQPCESP
ncbi:methyltransferase domain-containing protein [Desulfogranum mediterraneum]|uniref:methyltransferase domain-containing protein n=1 Tax=Desulfogranum mediterraneum TaxID=160661 RepID=UPI000420F10D|nr:methyltransferase domain-containing protein [Desulfogranum mediterraneum]